MDYGGPAGEDIYDLRVVPDSSAELSDWAAGLDSDLACMGECGEGEYSGSGSAY